MPITKITAITGTVTDQNLGDDPDIDQWLDCVRTRLGLAFPYADVDIWQGPEQKIKGWAGDEPQHYDIEVEYQLRRAWEDYCSQ